MASTSSCRHDHEFRLRGHDRQSPNKKGMAKGTQGGKTGAKSAQYYFSIYYQVPAAAAGVSRFDGFYFPEFSFY